MKYLALAALTLCGVASPALSAEPWVAAGDTRVRHDVQFLVDEGVIELPMSAWPIPAADLSAALAKARPSPQPSPANAGEGAPTPSPAAAGEGGGEGSLTLAQAAAWPDGPRHVQALLEVLRRWRAD